MIIKISDFLLLLRTQIYKTFNFQKRSLYVLTCKYVTFICFYSVTFEENSLKVLVHKREFEIV